MTFSSESYAARLVFLLMGENKTLFSISHADGSGKIAKGIITDFKKSEFIGTLEFRYDIKIQD